ncbi:MAG: hypothetical protein ABIH23_08330 [bacterium]
MTKQQSRMSIPTQKENEMPRMPAIPEFLRICGIKVFVDQIPSSPWSDALGRVNTKLAVIAVDPIMSIDVRQATVWHEILHFIGGEMGIESLTEHQVLGPLANALYRLLKDNPALVGFLTYVEPPQAQSEPPPFRA